MTTVHPTTELFMMTAGEDMMEYQAHLDQGSLVAVEDLDIEIESKEQTVKDTEDENMFGDGYGMEEQIMQEADGVTLGNDEEMGDEQHHQHPMEDELLVDADDYHHGETVDDILDEDIQDNFEDVGQNISEHHDILQNNFSTEAEFELDDLDYVDEHSHEPQNFDDHIDENGVSANDVHAPEVGSNSADGPTLVSEVDGGDHYSSVEQPTVDATSGSLPTYSNTRDAKDYKRHGDESETPANDGLEDFNFEGDDLLVSEDEDLGDLVAPEERPSVPGPSFQGQEVITSSDANSVHRNAQITNEGSLEQAENLSQVGQTHIGSFEGHAHPIIVHYQENEISLFPPVTENESSETYFLADEGLARESLRTILQACKSVLADSIGEEEELEIKVPCLKLRVLEVGLSSQNFRKVNILM